MQTNESNLVSIEAMADERSDERQAAWNVLRTSPTVRMLAALAGPYWPQPTARETDRRAARQAAASRVSSCIERREALLDDALDDSFPASDPPTLVAPGFSDCR
jgi:hypothetical protein